MEQLWERRKNYKRFDPKVHRINETCGSRHDMFIPYKRKYGVLSPEQLQELIQEAKRYHWQALDLSACGLVHFPDELWELSELRMLYLGNHTDYREDSGYSPNTFSAIPRKIEQLRNLQVLSLSNVSLIDSGDAALKLEQLIHLDIFYCGYCQFPSIFQIPTLEGLGFNGEYLPESFSIFRNLRDLYLSGSPITTLPSDIGELSRLEVLFLHRSKIASLPESLREVESLTEFDIEDTPLAETLPPEILNQSAKEILHYVLSQQSDVPKHYFNESKMVIVGQGHVGKSCVLNRLIDNTYTENPSTEGIDISPWYFYQNGQSYKLNVWDFGGQEIYHSTHQFFLTERSLYLLVWDALAEDEYGRIDYWLKTIQSFAAGSPVIIVVNKCDHDIGRIQRIDEEDYRERFPQIQEVVYISCKDNINIDYLRSRVKSLAINLPLMKTSWLSSWMSVRKKLEQEAKRKNYIRYGDYLSICASEHIENEEALSLIKYLHDLGIVLFYHEDPLLKDLVILSSEWGTDAVYKVLDEQEQFLKGRNGILYMQDLPNIWSDMERYPESLYPYLLNLMERFQLAFKINSTTYLVAELLDNKAIEPDCGFDFGKTLSFYYEYDFIPAGVITRFIVAINFYLKTIDGVKQCWRKGAYLQHKSAYALVRLYDNITERCIQIKVSGVYHRDRQELLTKIRTVFDEINSQFKQIRITERIPCNCDENCDFLFDYETLLRAESMGKPTVECHRSLKDVSIGKLLDGVDLHMNAEYGQIIIQNNPHFSNATTVTSTSAVANFVSVTAEVRECIYELQGGLNDLKSEVGNQSEEFDKQCQKIQDSLEMLETCQSKEEIQKTGAMSKIRRFLMECNDPDSQTGKLLAGVKYAAGIMKDLAGKYNKVAKWMALPQLPFGDN